MRLLPSFTLTVWAVCAIVGGVGLAMTDGPPAPPRPPPMQATMIQVQIDAAAPAQSADVLDSAPNDDASPTDSLPPAMAAPASPSDSPPLVAVAQPSPAIAFALPTTGPTKIVADPTQAIPVRSPTTVSATAPAIAARPVHHIVYGQGEGRQPAPEYPREAAIARQQGTVVVRFTVTEDGRVEDAIAAVPCSFAILNQAAVRAVRDTWRFSPGEVRSYEVSIEFQLKPRK